MICSQKACREMLAFTHFIQIFAHLVTRFFKIKVSRFVTKSYRERDNDDGEEDLARFWTIRISLEARSSWVQGADGTPKWAKWRPAADARLYWDSYCNGIREMQCRFWWFFEPVGPQKRSHTLPLATSLKKHICNIK